MAHTRAIVLCALGMAVAGFGILFLVVLLMSLATGLVLNLGSVLGCAIVLVGVVLLFAGVHRWERVGCG